MLSVHIDDLIQKLTVSWYFELEPITISLVMVCQGWQGRNMQFSLQCLRPLSVLRLMVPGTTHFFQIDGSYPPMFC